MPLTVIEPAMHHFAQSDDHPVADMRNGQAFLKGVYDTLRSKPDLWRKTLLIITCDEHGGCYDQAPWHGAGPLFDPENGDGSFSGPGRALSQRPDGRVAQL